ncbi:T9SS type A sorting domain-containing protein [Cryomorpha ignava]|uniref:T9SS type A sorting domain-containing protein n=1 Tax=Cryomorpha ignava TaxID=101383 RepID=A0A7K3WRK3_9FLAO|nr:T9SS type A sorting domain-containing protein [Cryomorpha ignava]NEN24310.1 T9SS type A sorting domain-containing protein [Cryomorpha ignava]
MKKIYLSFSMLFLALSAFCQDIDYTLYAQWSSADSTWESTTRRTNSFDSGNLVMVLAEYLYPDSSNWHPFQRTINEYNNDQTVSETRSESWNTGSSSWEILSRTIYSYYSTGFILSEVGENRINDAWIPLEKAENNYDSDNILIEKLFSNWDTLSNDWLFSHKYQYSYYPDGKLANVITEKFLNSQWVHHDEMNYSYTDFGKIAETAESLNIANDGSISGTRTRYIYDDSENLISKVRESIFQPTQDWRPVLQYNYSNNTDGSVQSFIRQVNMGIDSLYWINFGRLSYFYLSPNFVQQPEPFSFALFPNPVSDEFHIQIDEITKPVFYKVVNMEGKTVISGSFNSANKSVNTSGIAAGFYLIEIRNGEKAGFAKFVKE